MVLELCRIANLIPGCLEGEGCDRPNITLPRGQEKLWELSLSLESNKGGVVSSWIYYVCLFSNWRNLDILVNSSEFSMPFLGFSIHLNSYLDNILKIIFSFHLNSGSLFFFFTVSVLQSLAVSASRRSWCVLPWLGTFCVLKYRNS